MTTSPILIAVAQVDLILCTIAFYFPRFAIAFSLGFIVGKMVIRCRPKK